MKLLLIGNGYLGQAIASEFRNNAWDITPVSLSGSDGSLPCDVGNPTRVPTLLAKRGWSVSLQQTVPEASCSESDRPAP